MLHFLLSGTAERNYHFHGLYIEGQGHGKWPKTVFWAEIMDKYLQTHIEVLNSVLVRVPINNYNYEQLIGLFSYSFSKKHLHHGVIYCRCFTNCFYSTHINANVVSTIIGLVRSHLICSYLLNPMFVDQQSVGREKLSNLQLLGNRY